MTHPQAPKNPKTCEDCDQPFMPRSGSAKRCDDCRATRDKAGRRRSARQRSAPEPPSSRSIPKKPTPKRIEELRNSSLAARIDERVRKRIEAMED